MDTLVAIKLTECGISAIREGNLIRGGNLLVEAIQSGVENDQTWLWLSSCVSSKEEQRYCLSCAIEYNSENIAAKQGLLQLGNGPARRPALLSEPQAQIMIRSSSIVKNIETLDREAAQLLNEIDSLARSLLKDRVRLGRWLGYGTRLLEEMQAKM